jgi:hypothetical protein
MVVTAKKPAKKNTKLPTKKSATKLPPEFTTEPSKVKTKKKLYYATAILEFQITDQDIKNAKCKDPNACVIAQAVRRQFGDFFEEVHVGARITKIVSSDRVVAYGTSETLAKGLRIFDLTGDWRLTPGYYRLNPVAPSDQRHHLRKTRLGLPPTGRPADVFKAKAVATRRVIPSNVLVVKPAPTV